MINFALSTYGSTITANKAADSGSLSNAVNGSRRPLGSFGANGLQLNGASAWIEIAFNTTRQISEIDVIFANGGDLNNSDEPTLSSVAGFAASQGIEAQYWNGASRVTIVSLSGNDKQRRQFTFSAL